MMKNYRYSRPIVNVAITFVLCVFHSHLTAAPGLLSDQPLTDVSAPPPNVLLILDDSGSMYSTQAIRSGAPGDVSLSGQGGNVFNGIANYVQVTTDESLFELCPGYNALAYDPNTIYKPWISPGNEADTSPLNTNFVYLNQTAESALLRPELQATTGNTVDLTDNFYLIWNDLDEDNDFDTGECGPGVAVYDNGTADVLGQVNAANGYTTTTTRTSRSGIIYDNGGPTGNYTDLAPDTSTQTSNSVVIDVAGETGGTLTIEIQGLKDIDYLNGRRSTGDDFSGDVIRVSTGDGANFASMQFKKPYYTFIPNPDGTSPRVTQSTSYIDRFSGITGFYAIPDTYTYTSPFTITATELTYNSAKFVVNGTKATITFHADNVFTRSGFKIVWYHSSDTSITSADDVSVGRINGIVDEEDCSVSSNCVRVDSLTDAEKTNYANWFTYYRSRDFTAKNALAQVVNSAPYRMGFATINDRGNGGVPIKDLSDDDIAQVTADRNLILRKIYQSGLLTSKDYNGNGIDDSDKFYENNLDGTNLRRVLDNAGKYFQENSNPETASSFDVVSSTVSDDVALSIANNFFGTTVESVSGSIATVKAVPLAGTEANPVHENTIATNKPLLNEGSGGQCQQNFTLLFTDGSWTFEDDYTTTVGNVDADDTDNIFDGGTYEDSYSNTLADIAMYYFKNDLSPTALDNDLNVELHNQVVTHQHMVTFGIGFGVTGTPGLLDRIDFLDPSNTDTNIWQDPLLSNAARIDDVVHASYNARGNYYSASDPASLQVGLDAIIKEISVRTNNTGTGVSFSSLEFLDDELRFDVTYSRDGWWGQLASFKFANGVFLDEPEWLADSEMRNMADRHNQRQIITFNGQKGVKFAFPADFNSLGENELSQTQVDDLFLNKPTSYTTTTQRQLYGEYLVQYLRGRSSRDIATEASRNSLPVVPAFRDRDGHYIGALIHSQPEFVGAPKGVASLTENDATFNSFIDTYRNRREVVYVGGNDGMLHAFYVEDKIDDRGTESTNDDVSDDLGGKELFAYIPSVVSNSEHGGKGLNLLAQQSFEATPYVDGQITSASVYVTKATEDDPTIARWRTYLVGGFRAGGQGIYVLDVTNPTDGSDTNAPNLAAAENTAEHIVVREFTHPDLGYTYGEPKIALMNNNRWAAVVGNGYNNDGNGTAQLFIIYLDAQGGHDVIEVAPNVIGDDVAINCIAGENCGDINAATFARARYSHATLEAVSVDRIFSQTFSCTETLFESPGAGYVLDGCVVNVVDTNGLSEPALHDSNNDGKVDRIYAGDLHGNMWAFDVSSSSVSEWGVASDNGEPLFVACQEFYDADTLTYRDRVVDGVCPLQYRQPITTKPEIISNVNQVEAIVAGQPNLLIMFGTGQYLTEADEVSTNDQAFYGVWDAGKLYRNLTPSKLVRQVASNTSNGVLGDIRVVTRNAVTFDTSLTKGFGWRIVFPPQISGAEERVVLNPILFGDVLFFNTLVPTAGTCNATSGTSITMGVNPLTGGATTFDIFGSGDVDGGFASGIFHGEAIVGFNIIFGSTGVELSTTNAGGEVSAQGVKVFGGDNGEADSENLDATIGGPGTAGRKSWSILH